MTGEPEYSSEQRVIFDLAAKNEELRIEVERLKVGLQMLAKQEYDAGYTPEGFAKAILSGDEP